MEAAEGELGPVMNFDCAFVFFYRYLAFCSCQDLFHEVDEFSLARVIFTKKTSRQ